MKDNPWLSFDIGHPATKALQCGARKGGSKYAQFNESAAADKKDFLGKLHLQILARAVWVASEEVRGGFRAAASPGCAGTSSHKWTHRPLPRHFNVSVKRTFSACRVKQQRDPSSAVQQAVIVGSLGSNVKNLFYKCVKSHIIARLLIQAND